jgi:large subunit ribosomal protein L17
MRHLNAGRKLNRTSSHRKALFRNLAASLLEHESIQTTNPKALELRRVTDRLISLVKRSAGTDTTHAMRLAFAYLRNKEVVKKLFADIGSRYTAINGGYTRVVKIGRRKGDAAPMAIIELTQKKDRQEDLKIDKKAEKAKKEAKAKKKDEAKPKKAKKEQQTESKE